MGGVNLVLFAVFLLVVRLQVQLCQKSVNSSCVRATPSMVSRTWMRMNLLLCQERASYHELYRLAWVPRQMHCRPLLILRSYQVGAYAVDLEAKLLLAC